MLTTVLAIAGLLVVLVAVFVAVFIAGVRLKWGFVLRPLFSTQRQLSNPSAMKTAGKDGATYSVVRHRGRTSGREYETPVGVVETAEGFLIALPYGSETNWVRNVLAGGSAQIVHQGKTWNADQPAIVPMRDVVESFGSSDRRAFRLFGVRECLRLRKADAADRVGEATGGAASVASAPASSQRGIR